MTPISESYLIDCMEYMRNIPDKYFNLAIVDPPYGLDKKSTQGGGKLKDRCLNRGNMQRWDISPSPEYFKELFRVSRNQIIWGGNYFPLPPYAGVSYAGTNSRFGKTSHSANLHGHHSTNQQNILRFPTGADNLTRRNSTPHKNRLPYTPIYCDNSPNPEIKYSIPTSAAEAAA